MASKASGLLATFWAGIGLGPVLASIWGRVASIPPISWVVATATQVAHGPVIWRIYYYYFFGDKLAQWLIPGLHAQLLIGTWLGILKTFNADFYTERVALRLRGLLEKQAKLRAAPGQKSPTMPAEVLDTLTARLKADSILADALGSTSALGIWHRLERTRLDDPKLLASMPVGSQARWVLEALCAGYLDDLEAASLKGTLEAARAEASRSLQALREAVDAAAFDMRNGLQGSDLSKVEKASAEAALAVTALDTAKGQAPEEAAAAEAERSAAWEAKLEELRIAHGGVPSIAAELSRLGVGAEAPDAAKGTGS